MLWSTRPIKISRTAASPILNSNQTTHEMGDNQFEYNLAEWEKLNETERNIINYYWDPYNPGIGQKTKFEIVNVCIQKTKIPARQFRIRSFGWTVYMLYLVVDSSKQKVSSNFLGLPINKGIIISETANDKVTVKFDYGGTFEMDLTEKIIIQ